MGVGCGIFLPVAGWRLIVVIQVFLSEAQISLRIPRTWLLARRVQLFLRIIFKEKWSFSEPLRGDTWSKLLEDFNGVGGEGAVSVPSETA